MAEALDELPGPFRERLDNVEVVVEDWPDRETMRMAQVSDPTALLGFYRGIPQTRRSHQYGMVLPDKISIYRRPIEMRCRTLDEVRDLVRHVVRHEIAHHFGIDDDRLREIEAY